MTHLGALFVARSSRWIVRHVELGDPSHGQAQAAWLVLEFPSRARVYVPCTHQSMR